MSTLRQKKLAKAIVDNASAIKPLNKKEILVSSGYTESSAASVPGRLFEQKGVKEELEVLGFTEENAKKVVQQILLDELVESHSRLKAADMIFKVKGTYAPEKSDITTKGEKITDSEALDEAAKAYGATVLKRKTG